ncbi:MAG: hypothetical protein SGJ17_13895, partial [Hyphomicrobiales bacterium]|nr:hypothetical protein [Hyphomicrobiales bacterium]
ADWLQGLDTVPLFEPAPAAPIAAAYESFEWRAAEEQPGLEAAAVTGTALVVRKNARTRKQVVGQAAMAAKTRAAAAMRQGASVIARNANRSQLEQNYAKAIAAIHTHVLDRKLEQVFFRPTILPVAPIAEKSSVYRYDGPVPRMVFHWAMSALPRDLKAYAFVDFRAQRGRAMMLAARCNFERIIGYEYDEKLHDDLQMNVAQFPRSLMACREIECVRGDLQGIILPDQPVVLYFSNAFRERFMSLIMSHVITSYRLHPRRMYIILENPPATADLGPDEIFCKINLPIRERALLKVLSPVRLDVYRSLV